MTTLPALIAIYFIHLLASRGDSTESCGRTDGV
jgi:hypothetical protein